MGDELVTRRVDGPDPWECHAGEDVSIPRIVGQAEGGQSVQADGLGPGENERHA